MQLLPEHQLLFACTRQHFQDVHQEQVSEISRQHKLNWDYVFSTARLHGVAPLVFFNLQKCPPDEIGLPAHIAETFKHNMMQNMMKKDRLGGNTLKAVKLFRQQGIEVMFVKGVALDLLVYEQPWYTATYDADMVIRLKRSEVSDEKYQTYMKELHGSAVEFDYYDHHDVTMNGILPVDFDRIWQDATRTSFKGHEILVMSPEDFLISVCINSCRKRYFRLKAMCDIAEIVNKYPQLNWDLVTEKARRYQCSYIVYTALLTTRLTLGCNLPPKQLDALMGQSVRKTAINRLIQRFSLTAYEELYANMRISDRAVTVSLLLPYVTMHWYQILRRVRFAWSTNWSGQKRE